MKKEKKEKLQNSEPVENIVLPTEEIQDYTDLFMEKKEKTFILKEFTFPNIARLENFLNDGTAEIEGYYQVDNSLLWSDAGDYYKFILLFKRIEK